jgi:serine/threonine-protein kinase
MELTPGLKIADRFVLERQLGQGGMGAVWVALHEELQVKCAIKFIEATFASNAEFRMRFVREARAAAQIRSPHVVNVLDSGVWNGLPYIAMELMEGQDLGHRLLQAGRLAPAETVEIMQQTCRALTKAHAAGFVHRDLKPDNIFLTQDDDRMLAKVLDFGIAKQLSDGPEGGTRAGALLGTPYYMSPEQALGNKSVDHRSDLWSLAVIAYECLTGVKPFDSTGLGELLMMIQSGPIPSPSQTAPWLPPTFEGWWQRAMTRDPNGRFQSARELGDALSVSLNLSTGGFHEQSMYAAEGSAMRPSGPNGTMVPVTPQFATPQAVSQVGTLAPKSSKTPLIVVGGLVLVGGLITAVLLTRGSPKKDDKGADHIITTTKAEGPVEKPPVEKPPPDKTSEPPDHHQGNQQGRHPPQHQQGGRGNKDGLNGM